MRDRVGDLLHTIRGGLAAQRDERVGDELVDGRQGHAGHRARRLLGLDDLEEWRQECARIDLA